MDRPLLRSGPSTAERVAIGASGGVAGLPVPPLRPPGYWRRDGATFPLPLTPFTAGWLLPTLNGATRTALTDLGALLQRIELREIEGYVYRRVVPLREREPGALARPFARLIERLRPTTRRRANLALRLLRSGAYAEALSSWETAWAPELSRQSEDLWAALPAADSSDAELDTWIERVLRHGQQALRLHVRVSLAAQLSIGLASPTAEDSSESAPPSRADDVALQTGEMEAALAALADSLRVSGETVGAPAAPAPLAIVTALAAEDIELRALLATFRRLAEVWLLGPEAAQSTLGEDDALQATLLRRWCERRHGPGRTESVLPGGAGTRSEPYLQRTAACLLEVDQRAMLEPLALARMAALHLGRRLAEREQIEEPADVFFLTLDEGRTALRDGQDRHDLARRRRAAHATALAAEPAPCIGEAASVPLAVYPESGRRLTAALLRGLSAVVGGCESDEGRAPARDKDTLRAVGAAIGVFVGPARAVRGSDSLSALSDGDILICACTPAGWAPFLVGAGAIVTASGGRYSAAAIMARQLGIPAVTDVGDAMSAIHDGLMVRVDGTAGVISPMA